MWYLTSEADPRIMYIMPQCTEIVIGRSVDTGVCNFAIPDDPSISRKHVTLSVQNRDLILQDLGSRYGTFINSEKIEPNHNVHLCDKDLVKFGKINSVWQVHEVNIVTCTSTLKGENLHNLKVVLTKIGGILKNEWDHSCEYLTMPAITLTIKVVLALVQCSHIVTTEFWFKSLEAINSQVKLPDPNNFLPLIIESTLNKEIVSFLPDSRRKALFEGKRFVFFSRRQFEMYRTVLQNSAATPLLLSESKMTKSSLCDKDVIVIQYNITSNSLETQTQKNQINDIINYLKNKNKRIVADAEIGLAILYCSLDKYCNPDFNFSAEVVKQSSGSNSKETNILVLETQETLVSHVKKENIEIDESLVSHDNSNVTSDKAVTNKRKLMDDNNIDKDICNKSKKIATEIANRSENNSKRKLDQAECTSSNPSKKLALDNEVDDGDFFNFNNMNTECKQGEKKLNLSKPLKRKADISTNEEDLFNFVETTDKASSGESSKANMLDMSKTSKEYSTNHIEKKQKIATVQEISAMRGTKLEELKKMNLNYNTNHLKQIVKQEDNNELDDKMKDLDLGFTVVKVKKELIIKKEPVLIEAHDNSVKNFKKFKKVWPVKMQVTIIPRSSMSMITTGGSEESLMRDKTSI